MMADYVARRRLGEEEEKPKLKFKSTKSGRRLQTEPVYGVGNAFSFKEQTALAITLRTYEYGRLCWQGGTTQECQFAATTSYGSQFLTNLWKLIWSFGQCVPATTGISHYLVKQATATYTRASCAALCVADASCTHFLLNDADATECWLENGMCPAAVNATGVTTYYKYYKVQQK